MNLFHLTRFLECPPWEREETRKRQEAAAQCSGNMGKLVKTRLLEGEELVLVQLDGEGGEGDPLLHHPVQAGKVGRLPAPGHCETL